MLDSIFHKTGSINHIDYVDAMFCFDMKDVEYYKKLNKKSFFLPAAADPKIYYPIETIKDIDISFVGVIYNNEKRIKILKRIISEFPENSIQFHGIYKPYYKNIYKWAFRENRKIFSNKNLMPSDVNLIYNRSKIVINIHHEQTKFGANPKVYEICATNTYQICDRNPYIESTFPENQIGLYDNENELIDIINKILSKKIETNPYDACINVISNHTIEKRIETIFDILKSL
jgi:spore maturation protein CgeB